MQLKIILIVDSFLQFIMHHLGCPPVIFESFCFHCHLLRLRFRLHLYCIGLSVPLHSDGLSLGLSFKDCLLLVRFSQNLTFIFLRICGDLEVKIQLIKCKIIFPNLYSGFQLSFSSFNLFFLYLDLVHTVYNLNVHCLFFYTLMHLGCLSKNLGQRNFFELVGVCINQ